MKMVIQTQFVENYGAHDWDGKGECPQYWKPKFGDTYIMDITVQQAQDDSFMQHVLDHIEHKDEYTEASTSSSFSSLAFSRGQDSIKELT